MPTADSDADQSRGRGPHTKPPAKRVPLSPFTDDPSWRLFITTGSQVLAWSQGGCEPVSQSSLHGVVAAKRARDGSVLAIADARAVTLHHLRDGQGKPRRLEATQSCRHLQFSHDSRQLFYTDTSHNSIQAYRLRDGAVQGPESAHPSSVTSFAVSCDDNFILSASAQPPTIHVENRQMNKIVPVNLSVPNVAAVTCAFHPSRPSVFALAFADGAVAAFDYNTISRPKSHASQSRRYARPIHTFKHLHDPSSAGSAGITGVQFVPGHRSRAITAGEDGRCFLIDFEQRATLGSWHIGAPVTSLHLRELSPKSEELELGSFLTAVGTVHGRCLVYDGNANKMAEIDVETGGEPVVDVEWVYGKADAEGPSLKPSFDSSDVSVGDGGTCPATRSRKKDTDTLYAQGTNPPLAVLRETNHNGVTPGPLETSKLGCRNEEPEPPDDSEHAVDPTDQSYMMLFSPVKKRPAKTASPPNVESPERPAKPKAHASSKTGSSSRSTTNAPQLRGGSKCTSPTEPGTRRDEAQKPGAQKPSSSNNPSLRRGEPTPSPKMNNTLLSEIRTVRARVEQSRAAKASSTSSLSIIAPYLPSNIKTTNARGAMSTERGNNTPEQRKPSPHADLPPAMATRQNTPSTGALTNEQLRQREHRHEPPSTPPATEDNREEEEEDIWLIQSHAEPKPSRKRKQSSLSTDEASSSQHLAIATSSNTPTNLPSPSNARSSKNRKTVGWNRELPAFSPMLSSSFGGAPLDENTASPATSGRAIVGGSAGGVEEVLKAVAEIGRETKRGFERQTEELTRLRREVEGLRAENHELRRLLEARGEGR